MDSGKMISIIIPVYNTEAYVLRCIHSVMEQSYRNLEIIVVDDGSPGNIAELMESVTKQDPRVRLVRHPKNKGLLQARVTGMAEAHGEYIAFLDSDDYVSYDFYRTLLNRAEQTRSDVVLGKTVWENGSDRIVYNLHESAFQFDILEGEQIRNSYFGQKANCYSWHTIWNKLYRRDLIERCYPIFRKMTEHIIMTEDIFFSSVLMYEATRMSRVQEEAYFYCSNEDASTNTSHITIQKFCKNVHDMNLVFNGVDRFLKRRGASDFICGNFRESRKRYACMWQNLLNASFEGDEFHLGQEKINAFCSDFSMDHVNDLFYFERISSPWKGVLEYFKQEIGRGPEKYISFDIFDTLIQRPFYDPQDLLELLNHKFSELTHSSVSFSRMRKNGEQEARREHAESFPGDQDITLTEIYRTIGRLYHLEPSVTDEMCREEIRLEIQYAGVRKSGRSLFEFAREMGKKILIVTDMYLEQDTIEEILEKNHLTGYERLYVSSAERKLKYSGDLFRCVLRDYPDAAGNTIHIGDTWVSDIEGSGKVGFRSFFLPKARELFEDKIHDYDTSGCGTLGKNICGRMINWDKVSSNLGIRTMKAMAANRYFDVPYRPFHPDSDLNCDPYFIGYYLLGMHLLGLCKWMDQKIADSGCRRIHFLARDGYLPMKAYEIYRKYMHRDVKLSYLKTSRKAMMPYIVRQLLSFCQLPVEFRAHTPLTLLKLLEFASKPMREAEKEACLRRSGIDPDAHITDESLYQQVIDCFLNEMYSPDQHEKACGAVRAYFEQIHPGDLVFDMGYSGRIQSAISDACHRGVNALFLHEDYDTSVRMRGLSSFKIDSFYDFRPEVTGLFREHILSDGAGSCIGYRMNCGHAEAVIEDTEKGYTDLFVIRMLQQGSLDFLREYLETFGDRLADLDFSPVEASLPLEEFMRSFSDADIRIFSGSYFEDEVYGAQSQINIESFLRGQRWEMDRRAENNHEATAVPAPPAPTWGVPVAERDAQFVSYMNQRSKCLRALLWLLVDYKTFHKKLICYIKHIAER